jgi:hypothetical protein
VQDTVLAAGRLLALARAGHVLAFDARTLAPAGERILPRRALCLGPADANGALAGLSNGAVVLVKPADLSASTIAEVPGRPVWVGRRSSGGLLIAYGNPPRTPYGWTDRPVDVLRLKDVEGGREYPVGAATMFLRDGKDRLWMADGGPEGKLQVLDLRTGKLNDVSLKDGWAGVQGNSELADGQVWGHGGLLRTGARTSFVVRVESGGKASLIWSSTGQARREPGQPDTPISHVVDDPAHERVLLVSHTEVVETDASLGHWKLVASLALKYQAGRAGVVTRATGRVHLDGERLLLTLAQGGLLEVTASRADRHLVPGAGQAERHLLPGQNSVLRPSEIVRVGDALIFHGEGGPLHYVGGTWRLPPETALPPRELIGAGRVEGDERVWAAAVSIPVDDKTSVMVTKAGARRWYSGHLHGMKDTVVTGRWEGGAFKLLGHEDLPIEPDDTFATPDHQLWNVDDQGLWHFEKDKWRMVMSTPDSMHGKASGGVLDLMGARGYSTVKSAVGEPLRFVPGVGPPWIGLPWCASSWTMARLDLNEAGGAPLIDDIPVQIDGERLQIRDAHAMGEGKLLLATDRGLHAYELRWTTAQPLRPAGLDGEVGIILRDRAGRVWLAGRGLWLLEGETRAHALHPAIPALAEADIISMAEAPDGRLALGLSGRGAMLLDVPRQFPVQFQPPAPELQPWEVAREHEGLASDQAIVVRVCKTGGDKQEQAMRKLRAALAAAVLAGAPRLHLGEELVYDSRADLVLYAPDAEKAEAAALPVLRASPLWPELRVFKRYGPPGSRVADSKTCGAR